MRCGLTLVGRAVLLHPTMLRRLVRPCVLASPLGPQRRGAIALLFEPCSLVTVLSTAVLRVSYVC